MFYKYMDFGSYLSGNICEHICGGFSNIMDTENLNIGLQHEKNYKSRIEDYNRDPPENITAMVKFYDEWADTYEKETGSIQYVAPRHAAEYLHKHAPRVGLAQHCEILDVAAGTGWAGRELRKLGYTNVDGEEPCEKMFQRAREQKVYRKYFDFAIGDTPMPIEDESYDAVVIAGALPHIGNSGLEDMIRVIRPGGLFVCAGKVAYVDDLCPWMMKTLNALQKKGILKKLEIDIPPDYFYMDNSALVLVYQKLS